MTQTRNNIHIHEYMKKDVTNAMTILSFPTVGIISTIAAHYLIDKLEMDRIGAILSDDFYPATVVENGEPVPPVRIYAGDSVCGPNGNCDQIVVITSELPFREEYYSVLADVIIDWCKENKCRLVISLEGVNIGDGDEEEIKVFHVSSTEEARGELKGLDLEPLNSGMVGGLSGVLLYKGNLRNFDVTALLAQAHSGYPDSRSAAAVINILDEMTPQIEMDPKPLLEKAEEIEDQIKSSMKQMQKRLPGELQQSPTNMYL